MTIHAEGHSSKNLFLRFLSACVCFAHFEVGLQATHSVKNTVADWPSGRVSICISMCIYSIQTYARMRIFFGIISYIAILCEYAYILYPSLSTAVALPVLRSPQGRSRRSLQQHGQAPPSSHQASPTKHQRQPLTPVPCKVNQMKLVSKPLHTVPALPTFSI